MLVGYSAFAEEIAEPEGLEQAITIGVMSAEDKKAELKELIDGFSVCNPEETAKEASLSAYKTALEAARKAYLEENDETKLTEAAQNLKQAAAQLEYIGIKGIITNNNFSKSVENEYYSNTKKIETNAVYEYPAGSEAMAQKDSDRTALSDGKIDTYAIVENTDENRNTSVCYDFGTELYISGTDVFSQFRHLRDTKNFRQNIRGYKVEISTDGNDYKQVASEKAMLTKDETGFTTGYLKTSASFPAVLARYVKITVTGDENSAKYGLAEIVLHGFKSPFSRDALYDSILNCSEADENIFTEESYNRWKTAFENAQRLYWDKDASGRDLYDAKKELDASFAELKAKGGMKVISGNIVNDFDKQQYAGMQTENIGMKYVIETDKGNTPDKSELIKCDSSFTKLLDGNLNLLTNGFNGGWSGNPTAEDKADVIFTLEKEAYISEVDLWDWFIADGNGNIRGVAKVKVSASSDGVNYTDLGEAAPNYEAEPLATGSNSNGVYSLCKTAVGFSPVKARYIKVSIDKKSYQMFLAEIVLIGCGAAEKDTVPFSAEKLDYKNENGLRIISADGEGKISISGEAVSNSPEASSAVIVTAAYKNGDIVDYSFSEMQISAYGSETFTNELDLKNESGVKLYTFIWDSLSGGKIMSRIKEFGQY